jgi:hypothetical protein
MFQCVQTLTMSATGYTAWVDVRRLTSLSVQTNCGDVNDPVGVITLEGTNDVATVLAEKENGTTPANSAAAALTANSASSVGDAWATAYNGVGAKVSALLATTTAVQFAFVRIKYTRTSGGAGDTLTVRYAGKVGF